jgi:hypothetical protein
MNSSRVYSYDHAWFTVAAADGAASADWKAGPQSCQGHPLGHDERRVETYAQLPDK